MSEPVDPISKLARFSPAAAVSRDDVMFAAGRASVRPARVWPLLAGLLAVSHVVTLVLLWPTATPPTVPVTVPPPAPQASDFISPASPAPGSILWLRGEDRLAPSAGVAPEELAVGGKPMRAGSFVLE